LNHNIKIGDKVKIISLPDGCTNKGIGYSIPELANQEFEVDMTYCGMEAIELKDNKQSGNVSGYIFTPENLQLITKGL